MPVAMRRGVQLNAPTNSTAHRRSASVSLAREPQAAGMAALRMRAAAPGGTLSCRANPLRHDVAGNMRALITGGTGNIGSRLAAALVERGDEVAALDIRADPAVPSPAFARVRVWTGGVDDAALVDGVVRELRPDAIFHLGAILSAQAEERPDLAWRVNLEGTRNVLAAAHRHDVSRVVFTSTIATYGAGVALPVTEATPQWPAGLYGVTKVAGERLGVYYHHRFGLDFRGVRLSAMVAPRPPAGGAASAFVCELFIEAVRRGAYTFQVYPTSRVPIVWVGDVVRALILLHDAPPERLRQRVYNIIGACPSVAEMAAAVTRRLPQVRFTFAPDPVKAPIVDSWPAQMDDSAARADWGWAPQFDLERMTDATLAELRR
ncbi:MAG: NAD-dependent epimerase/dehydratase family protein [Myxococcales bacterium]|nr:NAD-dependent epimerase/dehydratase family protein [Myxococcales bacterium]